MSADAPPSAAAGPPTDPRAVYAQTEAGRQEIVERRHGLSAAARRVLILIDGRVPVGDLPRHARPGDIEGIVGLLESLGLVERIGTAEPAARLTTAHEQRTLTDAKRELAAMFESEIGASGLVPDARVQDSVSLDLLRRVLREAIEMTHRRFGTEAAHRIALRARHLRLFEARPARAPAAAGAAASPAAASPAAASPAAASPAAASPAAASPAAALPSAASPSPAPPAGPAAPQPVAPTGPRPPAPEGGHL